MRPWSRLDARVAAVLLLSIFTPWAIAEDVPARRTALKIRSKIQRVSEEEDRPSDQAVQRWGQLKSRYSASDDEESRSIEQPPRTFVTARYNSLPSPGFRLQLPRV